MIARLAFLAIILALVGVQGQSSISSDILSAADPLLQSVIAGEAFNLERPPLLVQAVRNWSNADLYLLLQVYRALNQQHNRLHRSWLGNISRHCR